MMAEPRRRGQAWETDDTGLSASEQAEGQARQLRELVAELVRAWARVSHACGTSEGRLG